jgi:hypothetical protein
MPHWLTCTSSSRPLAALGVITAIATGDTRTRAAPDVRPHMAVTVEIKGDDYEQLLPSAERDMLLRLMQDSLRTLLEQNFGFLQWRDRSGPLDTLRVRWNQRSAEPQDGQLELALRGPRMGPENALSPLPFEKWARLQTRLWQAPLVSREWSATIDTIFKRQRADLTERLFGRMPLRVSAVDSVVRLLGSKREAVVRLRPEQFFAADSAIPEFMVRLTVKDTVEPQTVGPGELELRRCIAGPDSPPVYVCRMTRLVYRQDTTSAEDRRELLARAVLVPRSLHLLRYEPRRVVTGPGGTVSP